MTPTRALTLSCFAALIFGLCYRMIPVFGSERTLASLFLTEDGYLLLTVSRNMAIGNGITVSDGTIWTNGFQPLITFLFTIPYLLTGGDKVAGLFGVTLIQIAISIAAAFAIRRFAARALDPQVDSPAWSWLVTALWFIGPLLLLHSMNGLETGLVTLVVVVTALFYGNLVALGRRFSVAEQLLLGLLAGLCFLARNDAVFFIAAMLVVRFVQVRLTRQQSFTGAVSEAILPGLTALAVGAPWMIYNYRLTGSIIPISGQSQSFAADFGGNLSVSPIKLMETMFPMFPVPTSLEGSVPLLLLCALLAGGTLAWFLLRATRRGGPFLPVIWAYTLYAVGIFSYYSLEFGAPWFLSRYFAPLAPLLLVAAVSVMYDVFAVFGRHRDLARCAVGIAALLLCAVLLSRLLLPGVREQGHFQVVDWVEENVPDEVWVGAIQTGTLGYWHDRTINLDGKVNPAALEALLTEGDVLDYTLRTDIEYLVDWVGIAKWPDIEGRAFNKVFETLVEDPERNLGVLGKRATN